MFVDTPKNGSKLLFYYVCSFVILSCLNKSHGNFRDFKRVFSYNWKVKPKEKNLIICSIESIYIYIYIYYLDRLQIRKVYMGQFEI